MSLKCSVQLFAFFKSQEAEPIYLHALLLKVCGWSVAALEKKNRVRRKQTREACKKRDKNEGRTVNAEQNNADLTKRQ